MKNYITTSIPAKTREVLVSKTCDICKEIHDVDEEDSWTGDKYNILETEIRLEEGSDYGYDSGGNKEITEVDICPDCFKNHLIPWLESIGATIRKKEVDW
jgi:hypothetical protein